ncbi:hypothetical protein PINS_up002530 [Pythium insidiosum]|nr:hypothetical protein PINS_up002530 [Pythium insidiosum]
MPKEEAGGVDVGGYRLHAKSVAGVHSCCYVESVDVAFDIGCCFGRVESKSHVFITHGHVDHIAAFVQHAARRALQRMKPAKYYVLPHLIPHMEMVLKSFSAMQEDAIRATIVPIEPLTEIHVDTTWSVRAFPTCHRVPSVGFVLYRKTNKLREDLVGMDGKEIAALRRAGEVVSHTISTPEIAYTGDTTIEVFERAEAEGFGDLLRVKVLITEATYIDDSKTSQQAVDRGHIHLNQLVELQDRLVHVGALVLVHSSAKYRDEELVQQILSRIPSPMKEKCFVAGR